MPSFASRRCGMKRSPRRLFRDRRAGGKCQSAPPELPGAVAEPARLRMQHDFNQPRFADGLLEQKDVFPSSKIHGLRDDALFGMRLFSDRLPPEVFAAEFRDRLPGVAVLD